MVVLEIITPLTFLKTFPGFKTLNYIGSNLVIVFYGVLNDGLRVFLNDDIVLEQDKTSLGAAVRCLVVLPSDFSESLIYQHPSFVLDYLMLVCFFNY